LSSVAALRHLVSRFSLYPSYPCLPSVLFPFPRPLASIIRGVAVTATPGAER
jgi:hypothetical protein